jgi:hypothetical protein
MTNGQRKKPRASPGANEEILRSMVAKLVATLLHPDDACREANVTAFMRICEPPAQGVVIDALIDRLAAGDSRHDRVLATLSQLGHRPLPALVLRFTRTCNAALQHDILTTLTKVANRLTCDQSGDLLLDLMTLSRFAVDDSVRASIGNVIRVHRKAQEAAIRKESHVKKPPAAPGNEP